MPKHSRLVIIDGHALIHQAYHAIPPLTTSKGEQVNAVYGFAVILLRVIRELKPKYLAVAFDVEGGTFRDKKYAEYKATRVKAPDDLYEQIPRVRELVEAFRIPVLQKKGFEADDIIGTIAKKHLGSETIIVTGDMDAFQLIDAHTKVFKTKRATSESTLMDAKAVKEKYGLKPEQIVDYKALRGDASDNIPGVKGIGEKTATALLQTFGSLEAIYAALENNSKKFDTFSARVKELLKDHKKDAFDSQELATIVTDVKIPFKLQESELADYDRAAVAELFQELEFKSLMAQLPQVTGGAGKTPEENRVKPGRGRHRYELIDDDAAFKKFFTALMEQTVVAIDTETDSLETTDAKLIGISFSWKEAEAYFVHVRKHPEWAKALQQFFEKEAIAKVGHNMKYDLKVLWRFWDTIQGITFDSMVASYLLVPGSRSHKLDALVFAEFGYEMQPITDLIGKKGKAQRTLLDVPIEKTAQYAAEDADYTLRLYKRFLPQLKEKELLGLFEEIEMPLIAVLARMEQNGVTIDVPFLKALGTKLKRKIRGIEERIYKEAGGVFNINSPKQLKAVLFEKLKISSEGLSRTKTGVSTKASELEKMQGKHSIIDHIMEYRELTKLVSTYLDALPELVHPKTGRIYTSFNQVVAATGRLSSSDPNLQNIPVRTTLGREIRKAFVAPRGFRLLSCDYSQIELRLIAALSKDRKMVLSFKRGEDIHAATAAEINGVKLEEVTEAMRYAAKAVNFGVIYGQGAYGLAKSAGISRAEAQAFIERYFALYSGVAAWLEKTKAFARRKKYVETLFGRRRPLPEIDSSNPAIRAAAERMAVNMPLQGTAADLMKKAMVEIHRDLHSISRGTRMILQVHDELVFEVPERDVKSVAEFVREKMVRAITLPVPIVVDAEVGRNWGEMHPLE